MTDRSLLWIESARFHRAAETLRKLRDGGLLPVAVPSTERALHLLGQFRVAAVVLHVGGSEGWEECARLLAAGSPVAAMVEEAAAEAGTIERYLSAGCAAVISASCPPDKLAAALGRVATGQRGIVCPERLHATRGSTQRVG